MKKTEIQNIILEDNKNNYSFKLDKEKLFKNIDNELVKDNCRYNKKTKINKTFFKYLITVSCCIVVIVMIGISYFDQRKSPKTTSDFKKYVSEYVLNNEMSPSSDLHIDSKTYFYIYKYDSYDTKDGYIYYFYYYKSTSRSKEVYLIDNNTQEVILLKNNAFGIIAIHEEKEKNKNVNICLKINGEIKNYAIN